MPATHLLPSCLGGWNWPEGNSFVFFVPFYAYTHGKRLAQGRRDLVARHLSRRMVRKRVGIVRKKRKKRKKRKNTPYYYPPYLVGRHSCTWMVRAMKHPKWLPTGEVETYITARGVTAHRPRMVPNPAYREPSASAVTQLAVAYERDRRTCQRCARRVHWFVMPRHLMAPALDDEGRLVHVECADVKPLND